MRNPKKLKNPLGLKQAAIQDQTERPQDKTTEADPSKRDKSKTPIRQAHFVKSVDSPSKPPEAVPKERVSLKTLLQHVQIAKASRSHGKPPAASPKEHSSLKTPLRQVQVAKATQSLSIPPAASPKKRRVLETPLPTVQVAKASQPHSKPPAQVENSAPISAVWELDTADPQLSDKEPVLLVVAQQPQPSTTTDQQMAVRIAGALAKVDLEDYDIEIECQDGNVTLKGYVDSRKNLAQVTQVVEAVPDVKFVTNRLSLLSSPDEPSKAAKRLIRSARRASKDGDLEDAKHFATEAKQLNVTYGLFDDRPELIQDDIEK